MASAPDVSPHNPAIKRLHRELRELQVDPQFTCDPSRLQSHAAGATSEETAPVFCVYPVEDNFFTWHFKIRGVPESDYAEGVYHGRVEFPPDYPFSPPNFLFLTPNGRFETRTKICLSVTTFHAEAWQPAWGVRTMLLAIREHFKVEDRGAVGYLSYSGEERRRLARLSLQYRCPVCHEESLAGGGSAASSRISPSVLFIAVAGLVVLWAASQLIIKT